MLNGSNGSDIYFLLPVYGDVELSAALSMVGLCAIMRPVVMTMD